MTSQTDTRVAFDDRDAWDDEMHSTITEWIEDLSDLTAEAAASEQFQEWLDVQSRFHEYSYQNTLLIKAQCPEATKVAGYHTWQSEFERHVREGESAIWIWAPIVTTRCPECENTPSYHDRIDCEYDETPPEEWSEGLVGFRPTSVFDVSQTEGEPLPELDTAASKTRRNGRNEKSRQRPSPTLWVDTSNSTRVTRHFISLRGRTTTATR